MDIPTERELAELTVSQLEGGKAIIRGDSGGRTLFGITERFYPDYIRTYWGPTSVDAPPNPGALDAALTIYIKEYIRKILGHEWLRQNMPWFLTLLVFGRVHGAGFRQYVGAAQRALVLMGHELTVDSRWGPATLKAIQALTELERARLYQSLSADVPMLIRARQRSVKAGGSIGVDKGISNRVQKEFTVAGRYSPRTLDSLGADINTRLAATRGRPFPLNRGDV